MSHHTISTALAAVVLAATASAQAAAIPAPPVAAKTAWQESRHGEIVTDDYRWLQKKENPDVIAHLNAENAYTEAMTADIKPLADKLYAEIKGRMQETDLSVPVRRGAYYYYNRLEAGKQYQINCRRRADAKLAYDPTAPEEILLDQNQLAEGQKFFAVLERLGQSRRPLAGVRHRHHRLSPVHAARQGPQDRQAAGRQRAARHQRWRGRPTTRRCSSCRKTPPPNAATCCCA